MPGPGSKSPRLLAIPALVLVAGLVLSACGTETVDVARGRQLFLQRCGSCHALAQAGSTAQIGPDLDAAFVAARQSGMDSDTVEGVVLAQIENPRPSTSDPRVSMPAKLVTGQDAADVAAYVGDVAGVPGVKPPPFTPASAFTSSCGSCHTLKAAGASGTVGPDLDQVLAGQSPQAVSQSITDPNAKITKGFAANVMPQNFGDTFSPQQLQALVKYLLSSAGK